MEIWQALVLGLVQGLGEFLPVSSSGHLVLAREIMGISGDYMLFDIMVHVGTLLAVLVAFYKDIIALFKPPFKTIGLLLLASVPAAVVGLLLNDTIADFFSDAKYIGFFFLFTAVLMLATEWLAVKRPYAERELPLRVAPSVGIKAALIMGGMQAVALFPGISRSGSTIFGGTLARSRREDVAKFSFFMSVPVILGSALLSVIDVAQTGTTVDWGAILIGMAAAFVSGLAAIKLMMRLIQKANYKWFSLYLFVVAVLSFVFFFCLGW